MPNASERIRTVVDQMTAAYPDLGGAVTDIDDARRLLALRVPPARAPIDVGRVEDRTIAVSHGEVPVRIYSPTVESDRVPGLVVFFHGGGWAFCNLDSHDHLCRRLCRDADVVVVSVDYRRSPDHRFPAAVDDADAALEWAAANAASLGADPSRLAVAGDSAGANLAAVAAQTARDRGLALRFQLLVYPITAHGFDTASYRSEGRDWFLTEQHMRWYWSQYLGPDGDGFDPRASPLLGNLADLAPAFVVTAEHDPLRDEGEAYADALRVAGVPVTSLRALGLFHGFFERDDLVPEAAAPTAFAIDALRRALAG